MEKKSPNSRWWTKHFSRWFQHNWQINFPENSLKKCFPNSEVDGLKKPLGPFICSIGPKALAKNKPRYRSFQSRGCSKWLSSQQRWKWWGRYVRVRSNENSRGKARNTGFTGLSSISRPYGLAHHPSRSNNPPAGPSSSSDSSACTRRENGSSNTNQSPQEAWNNPPTQRVVVTTYLVRWDLKLAPERKTGGMALTSCTQSAVNLSIFKLPWWFLLRLVWKSVAWLSSFQLSILTSRVHMWVSINLASETENRASSMLIWEPDSTAKYTMWGKLVATMREGQCTASAVFTNTDRAHQCFFTLHLSAPCWACAEARAAATFRLWEFLFIVMLLDRAALLKVDRWRVEDAFYKILAGHTDFQLATRKYWPLSDKNPTPIKENEAGLQCLCLQQLRIIIMVLSSTNISKWVGELKRGLALAPR